MTITSVTGMWMFCSSCESGGQLLLDQHAYALMGQFESYFRDFTS